MELLTVAEHTICINMLPDKSNIADMGCRGFEFTNYFRNLGHNVVAIDCDNYLQGEYYVYALSDFDGYISINRTNDPQATHITKDKTGESVRAITLKSLCERFGINLFDVIKLDIESSEYEVIMSMDRPYATQISVEFHTHCGQTDRQVQDMLDRLYALGYKTFQHEKTARHGLKPNFWDSLFVLQ